MRGLALALSFVCVLLSVARSARAEDDPALSAARLEHKLAYLAADYAMAASSTAPSDDGESEEHVKLAGELERSAAKLPWTAEGAKTVATVSALVRRSAPAADVERGVLDARRALVASFHLPVAPSAPPVADHGRALFEQHCAPCHGATGRADTERAAALKPHPANFLDPSVGEPLSPYRVSTTVLFGVDGTPMVPFGFLSEADRWDVAFYVMGLRHVAAPAEEGPAFELSELASRSDAELRSEVLARGVRADRVEAVLTLLRRGAPYAPIAHDGRSWGGLARGWTVRRALGGAIAALSLLGLGGLLLRPRAPRHGADASPVARRRFVAYGAALVALSTVAALAHAHSLAPVERAAVQVPAAPAPPEVQARPAESAPVDGARVPPGAACASPGYGPGPDPSAARGLPPFVVLFNCLWPAHDRLEVSVALTHPARRAEVEALLKSLWGGLKARMGKEFPEATQVCVLPEGATIADGPLGCMKEGFEPEGEPGEDEPDLQITMRADPTEAADLLRAALAKALPDDRSPRVTYEPARREVSVLDAHADVGRGASGAKPSYVDAVLPLFVAAWEFYPPRADVAALSFRGVWKGEPLVRVRVADLAAFLAMDPWAVRERLLEANIPLAPGAARTDEQTAVLRGELEHALAKLPAGSVSVDSTLK
jgi:mono/diheme cytochrome c family protein